MPDQLWVSVLEVGSLYGLIGLAFYLTKEGTGLFVFAVGPFAMFSGLTVANLGTVLGWSLPLLLLVAVAATTLMSVATEVLVARPLEARSRPHDEFPALIGVVALLFIVEQFAGWVHGRQQFRGIPWVTMDPIRVGDGVIVGQSAVLFAVTLLCFTAAWLWQRYGRYGRMLRAVGDEPDAAELMALPVRRIRISAYVAAGLVCGLAGPLIAPKTGMSFTRGLDYAIFGFLAFVIAGRGYIWAPLLGGYLVAFLLTGSVYYLGSAWLDYTTLFMALVVLLVRPEGLLTKRVRA